VGGRYCLPPTSWPSRQASPALLAIAGYDVIKR
jgi:hypothetical protein